MNERLVNCIRDRTAVHFYQFSEVREALRFFDRNPLELSERVEELGAVAGGMNGLLTARPSKDGVFVNLENFREAIGSGTYIPTLADLQGRFLDGEEDTQYFIEATFNDMEQEIASGKFRFSSALDQSGRMASILLTEGYGLLLEKHLQITGLRAIFVLAFEEILVTKLSESRLFEDLLGQILGHKELFSPQVQQQLSSYETGP